jgi:hypothetical protein
MKMFLLGLNLLVAFSWFAIGYNIIGLGGWYIHAAFGVTLALGLLSFATELFGFNSSLM